MSYKIKSGDSLGKVAKNYGVSLDDLLDANPAYKANPNRINVGDEVVIPGQEAARAQPVAAAAAPVGQTAVSQSSTDSDDPFVMPFGQPTFDAEGLETPGPYFSRIAHVPSATSGVTIGRGYDMKTKSADKIKSELKASGVGEDLAARFGDGAGLSGDSGKAFIKDAGLTDVEITPQQQKELFIISYKELEDDVIRLCTKADVVKVYGATDWDNLDSRIKDIVVDLRFRGDYKPATRKFLQKHIAANDYAAFSAAMGDESFWKNTHGVPPDRFSRRRGHLA